MNLTPTLLTPATRRTLLAMAGFQNFEVDFIETCDKWILTSQRWKYDRAYPSLSPTLVAELGDITAPDRSPTFLVSHLDSMLARRSAHPALSLWEELLPAPWSDFVLLFRHEAGCVAQAFPSSFDAELKSLWLAFNRLEGFLARRELTCLIFEAGDHSLPILFHYLNGRRVHLGTLPEFDFLRGERSTLPERLKAVLGISAEVHHLVLGGEAKSPLANLSHALESLFSDASSAVPVDFHPAAGLPENTRLPTNPIEIQ